MPLRQQVSDVHQRFCAVITHRYFIRAHMGVMLALVVLTGLLSSRALLHLGLTNMAVRYPVAVAASYLVFFGLVRLWLVYVCRAALVRRRAGSGGSSGDWFPDVSLESGGGSGGGSGSLGKLAGGGGRFGGGGASASFADGEGSAARAVLPIPAPGDASSQTSGSSSASSFHLGSGKGGGGGGGGDGDGLLLLVLFVLLVAAVAGAGIYLVYQAPVILSEAAFQAVLASGLARGARSSHDPGWAGSLGKSTILPFLLVFALSGIFGYQAHKRCPSASTAREVLRTCVFH
jgi:hypothetical protein